LPSAIIGAPLACLAFQRFKVTAFRNFHMWLFAVIALLPSALWYWHAYQISLQFYPHHFFGAGGVKIMSLAWYLRIAKEIVTWTLTPFLFVLGGIGAIMTARSTSRGRMFHWWLGAMILFMVIVGYGNRHPWYQLPLIPIAAAFAGAACASVAPKISSPTAKIALSILLAALFGISAFVYARKFYQPSAAALHDCGLKLKSVTPPNALVVAADNGDPTVLYYAERKGWHFMEKDGIYYGEPKDSAQAIVDLEELRKHGASYLVFTSNTSWWLDYYQELGQYVQRTATLMDETSEFRIYKLNPVPK
jgi:hypothetical protein